MRGSAAVLVALVALAAAGCVEEIVVARPAELVLVHAILDMSARDQLVLLERSRAGMTVARGASSFSEPANPILGAQVTITGPDGMPMTAREDRLGDSVTAVKGLYRVSFNQYHLTLAPGGTYVLHVHTDRGEEVSGSTTIPRATAAAASAPEVFNRASDTLHLNWPHVEGAHSYEVSVQSSAGGQTYVAFVDSPLSIPGLARNQDERQVFFPNSTSQAVVSAVDVNYYEYYRVLFDIFLGAAPSHLTGAVGVFGSIVPLSVRQLTVH